LLLSRPFNGRRECRSGDFAAGDRLNAKGNRLVGESTEIMYDIGFAIGFDRFCSAKPG